jgi:hypothetical protein
VPSVMAEPARRRRRHRPGRIAAAIAVLAGLAVPASCSSTPKPECRAVADPIGRASPAPQDDPSFSARTKGWVGGDSTYSVPLGKNRVAWLFSDTLVRLPGGDPRRIPDLVRNSIVLDEGKAALSLRIGGSSANPAAIIPPPAGGDWYWFQDGTAASGNLQVFLSRTARAGQWFRWVSSSIATLDPATLEVRSIVPAPATPGVAWGAGLTETTKEIVVLGVEDAGQAGKHLHLAKVEGTDVTQTARWQFWTGSSWSPDPAKSARLLSDVSNELSVSPYRDGYLLITTHGGGVFSDRIDAYTACRATGPWTGPQEIYRTPESQTKDHISYNAHAHPELSRGKNLLISYNVNSLDQDEFWHRSAIYRPVFLTLPLR